MDPSSVSPTLLPFVGLAMGVLFALAVLLSHIAAMFLVRDSRLLDALVRLAVIGAGAIGLATLVGAYLGPAIRASGLWFWPAFFLGFFGAPSAFALFKRYRGKRAG